MTGQRERSQVRWSDDQALQEREARGSANARRAWGVSSPREETFAAPAPAIHVGWMLLGHQKHDASNRGRLDRKTT